MCYNKIDKFCAKGPPAKASDYDGVNELKENEMDKEQQSGQTELSSAKHEPNAALGAKTLLLYLHDFMYLLGIILVVLLICFRVVVVSGPSMKQTLLAGDKLLLITRTFYRTPEYGDIVVISKDSFDNGEPIVKRIIATENQWVDIDFQNGIVYIGDSEDTLAPLEEGYVNTPTHRREGMEFPLQVPEGCVFVMGDNRNFSMDSRDPQIGIIDNREILGRAVFLFFPGTDGGNEPLDLSRIGVID